VIDQTSVGKFNANDGKNYEIYLTAKSKPTDIDSIKKLPLVSRTGLAITVGDVADVTSSNGVSAIERYNGARFATIQARIDDNKNTMTVQKKFDEYLTDSKLKELGVDSKLNKGDIGDITKSFTELGIALLIAIILTYVFLVLQFKSFSLPIIMLYTIPLSLIGVFPALWLSKSQFGFLELLGITILVGIVENVAIFLIDYANQLVSEKGMSPKDAIIKASGVRFRPILLTKLVALGGLLPLAIESEFWRGLSIVIIAGIGLSGFFSLIVIPVLYVGIMGLRQKIHKNK
jgi:HAE1 family hydrophobic/amphiphilic exporter-1